MLTRFRLALLTCASLVAPAISLVHDFQRRDIDMIDGDGRLDHALRPRRRAHGRAGPPAGALARARADALDRRRRARGRGEPGGDPRRRGGLGALARRRSGHGAALQRRRGRERRAARGRGRSRAGRRRCPAPTRPRSSRSRRAVARPSGSSSRLRGGPLRRSRPRCGRSPRRWRSRSTASRSPRRCTGGAARRASARSCSTRAISSPCSVPAGRSATRARRSSACSATRPSEVAGRCFEELVEAGDRGRLARLVASAVADDAERGQAIECTLVHRDGEERAFEILMTNLLDDEHVGGIVLNSRDVSERKVFEEQLAHQAFHDGVTGLANRALFAERVRHAIARSGREQRGLAVIFLDLDDFKTINDSLGHAAGDEVLVEVARRLDESIRGADTAARFGGDEFAVLLEDVENSQEAADTAERILEALAVPLRRRPQGDRAALQPRHLGRRARVRHRRRRDDPRRRLGDVHRQARRQGRLPPVRAGDARGRARPPRAAHRPPARARHRAARAALPAGRATRGRRRDRRRGAAALAPSRARADPAGPLHPDRRGDGPDRADRALGAARGLPACEAHPRHARPAAPAVDEHQPVAQADPALRHRGRRPRRAHRVGPGTALPDARDHRDGADGRHRPRGRAPARAQAARRAGSRSTTSGPATRR